MAFVTDSNRPQPLGQPPPTACLTASGAASEVPSLIPGGGGQPAHVQNPSPTSACTRHLTVPRLHRDPLQVGVFWLWTVTYKKAHTVAWGGWSLKEAVQWNRVVQFLKQAGPAMLSLSLDRWAYQILALVVAGYLDATSLAAHRSGRSGPGAV